MPACASCNAPASNERIVDERSQQERVPRGEETWVAVTSCRDCLSLTKTTFAPDGSEGSELVSPGTETTRLRDALRRAAEDGTLRREIGRLMTSDRSMFLGVPEVFPDALPGIGKNLRLRTNVEVRAPEESRPAWLGPGIPDATEPWGGMISRRRQDTAIRGDGPGGVVPSRNAPDDPLKGLYGPILLVGLRIVVVGVRGSSLVAAIPAWAQPPLAGHSRILVAWGAARREED